MLPSWFGRGKYDEILVLPETKYPGTERQYQSCLSVGEQRVEQCEQREYSKQTFSRMILSFYIDNKCFADSLHLFVEWKREEPGGNELQTSW